MKTLLVDVGNSRIKWSVLAGARMSTVRSTAWRKNTLERTMRRILMRNRSVDAIGVCQVAGSKFARTLRNVARDVGVSEPIFVSTARRSAGVTNGYLHAGHLGVDRWMALLGARHRFPGRALCLFGAGTALTIDLIDHRGIHRGGAIVPGPKLMMNALFHHTALVQQRVRRSQSRQQARLFAASTRAAVENGCTTACAAVAVRALQQARELVGSDPMVLWTGGQAREIRKLAAVGGKVVDNLVIQGLAVSMGLPRR